jgi:hypothetical protein
VDFPGFAQLLPLADDGHERYAGARIKEVTVTNWHNADELVLAHAGGQVVLTPSSSTAEIEAGNWWFGSNIWRARRVADNEAWKNPEVELELECPTSPVGDAVTAQQGYGMTLQQLSTAIDTLTDEEGIGDLVAGAEDPTIPVYALRVLPASAPLPGGHTHVLRLELRGTWASVSLPLTETGQDAWSIDTDGPNLDVEGTATRSGSTLTLYISDGSLEVGGVTLDFEPTTLVLSALGGS